MRKVLIVEDNPMSAAINRKQLERLGNVEVIGPVTSLEETMKIMKKEVIDLILLDFYLPTTTGIEILRDLRKRKYLVDVIMITAAKNSGEIQEAFAYGIIDYLVKPFSSERFKEAITKFEVKHEVFNQKMVLEQADIDGTYKKQEISRNTLPKGLENRTLAKVLHTLEKLPEDSWTLKELASHIGVSNVTIKKYMDYLEEMNRVEVSINRGCIGRPELRYSLKQCSL